MLDLRLDLALGGGCKAGGAVLGAMAWHADDGDAAIVEMVEIDRDLRAAMGAGRHHAAVAAERLEGARKHLGVGDVVVENVDAAAMGEVHHGVADVARVVVDAMIGAEVDPHLDSAVPATGHHPRPPHNLLAYPH